MIPARDIDSIEEEQQQVTAEEDLIKLSIQQTQETIRKYKELLRKCGGDLNRSISLLSCSSSEVGWPDILNHA
jgi:DNA-binding protein H-NS